VKPAVEAEGVAKNYGTLVALENLTLAVNAGEVLGVLGPNGAGKTTAIRVLTTILRPSRGSFSVAGIPHTRPSEIRRLVGVLPESAGYPERQTGEEYLRYFARLYGQSRVSARTVAGALLAQVGLSSRKRSLIGGYSRGMRQRLGIARALVNDPRVVFLDEPTLGLDPAGQREIVALVRRISAERGATVLLSTHLLAEVEEVCSRVLILNHGRVAAEGTVSEIAQRAAAPRSARLRVPAEYVERARETLTGSRGIELVEPADGQVGSLVARLNGAAGATAMNDGLRALADAEVPVLAFELEGTRLSDAFLAMTEEE
jgi:ABC-2 type transport system ATP-binding protein